MKKIIKKNGDSLYVLLDKDTVEIEGLQEGDVIDFQINAVLARNERNKQIEGLKPALPNKDLKAQEKSRWELIV